MGIVRRGIVFTAGTVANGVVFLFLARVYLPILAMGEEIAGTGPATGALELVPLALQLAIGGLQIGLIVYLVGGIGEEAVRKPRVRP